ncbi:RING finger protein 223 [Acipenser ruthenus]|uniref:RING finger protein 223 n=1 Tax=Acipenser ruthenus TaxID=7906 RepID=UPI00145AE613|nr:RING finger protein 223 [Acipenser ruthenus]
MVPSEEMECGVCYLPYSRCGREPHLLHCGHTFCMACLDCVARERGGMLTLCCPLCRQITSVGRGLRLQEALWVDTTVWSRIPESEEEEEEEEEEDQIKVLTEGQPECSAPLRLRPKLKIPSFLKKLNFLRYRRSTEERCNIEMKAWRRRSSET